ncbi:metallophosphoesterase family protein [Corynebacterium sp. TAE3-ERU12]|uniref:metallophosphoesterase family protein n=1 Tax=Corynebacterium sp. TAE3-ERU12 TaxID=2849491 RepID=UPI001C43B3FD|nr:metallophosphoesterase [Corynebacterium sp. TAE3-ERU12]MBV7295907.1 metallophosphoesterase family protein [Corynebacterium sp. TAE3-ERU12]
MIEMSTRALRSIANLAAGGVVLARSSSTVSKLRRPEAVPEALDIHFGAAGPAVTAADLEVPTLTDTRVAFTWTTYASEVRTPYGPARPTAAVGETVLLGPVDGPMQVVHHDDTPRGVHHVIIDGLEPGREYRFECWSGALRAAPSLVATRRVDSPELTGRFRTQTTPQGRFIGTVAITNDTHIGKPFHSPGLREPDGQRPFAQMQLEELIADVKKRDIDAIVVNGDCTDGNTPEQVETFRRIMNGAGQLNKDWFAVRGNHDNFLPGHPPPKRRREVDVPDNYGAHFTPRQQHWSAQFKGLRMLGIDTATVRHNGGYISRAQMDAIRTEVHSDPDRPTIVFGHHPMTTCAASSNLGGAEFIVPKEESLELQRILADAPGVMSMFAGHTHRSRRGRADIGGVDYCERAASLGYPGGYSLVDVYEGGYMVSFHRTPGRESVDWSAQTRWSLWGIEAEYMLGALGDRNYVVTQDLSGLG